MSFEVDRNDFSITNAKHDLPAERTFNIEDIFRLTTYYHIDQRKMFEKLSRLTSPTFCMLVCCSNFLGFFGYLVHQVIKVFILVQRHSLSVKND